MTSPSKAILVITGSRSLRDPAALMDAAAKLGEIRVDNSVDYGARRRLDPVIEGIEAALGVE